MNLYSFPNAVAPFRPAIRRPLALAVALLVLGPLAGCAGHLPPVSGSTDSAGIEALRRRFEAGAYYDTVLGAQEFLTAHAGSRYRDEAMFLLARAHYEEGSFIDAEDQFRRLQRDFPSSSFAEEAAYQLALSLLSQARGAELDQTETEAALAQFRGFLRNYPESPLRGRAEGHVATILDRFAAKEYKNGVTYRKIGAIDAAVFYFRDKVIAPYPGTAWARRAALAIVECERNRRNWTDAAAWAERLIGEHPGTEEAAEAAAHLAEARRHLAPVGAASEPPATPPPR